MIVAYPIRKIIVPSTVMEYRRPYADEQETKTADDLLADSMACKGQLFPCQLNKDGEMTHGFRRYKAAVRLGWPVLMVDMPES